MAEIMLGKYNRSSSFEAMAAATTETENAIKSTPGLVRVHSDNSHTSTSSKGNNSDPKNADRQINIADKMDERRSILVVTPPKRRRRMTENHSAYSIVHDLNRSMSKSERIEALNNATAAFDHSNQGLHDLEIEKGADIALVKLLVFLDFKASFRKEPMKCDVEALAQEITTTLKCLECVYRASSDAVGKSFNRVGYDLLQILVTLIEKEIKRRKNFKLPISSSDPQSKIPQMKDDRTTEVKGSNLGKDDDGSSKTYDAMIRKATKIIGHFARVGKATRPMARFPGFLGSILHLCNLRPYSVVPFDARLNCLWTISNLACNADNMVMLSAFPNLINSLITISNRRTDSGATIESIMEILRAKSIASRTLLNLSWSSENKVYMAENPFLIQTLCKLAMERRAPYKNSKTMQNILLQTRRHSLASLRNISAAPKQSKISMCNYNNGELLDTLTDVMLNETDKSAVNFSFCAIHSLAINDTAEAIVERAALVLALKNVLLEDNGSSSREGETHADIKCQCASGTILILERAITPDKPSHDNLRELLDAINPTYSAVDCTEDESSSPNATAAV